MAQAKFDCELMLQPLPEKALTDAEHFHVLQDAKSRPIFICTAANESALMIAPDELGHNQVINLSACLKLFGKVKALAITQDFTDNSKIYLAIATQSDDNSPSNLHILKPFNIGEGRWWEKLDWTSLIFRQVENPFVIHRLLLASRLEKDARYPFLAAERSLPGVPKHNVSRIKVDTAASRWQWEENKLTLPFDVSKLDDLCVASSPIRSGIVFLDRTQGKPSVTFTDLRDTGEVSLYFNLPILPNPTSIATLTDRDGASNVLIAGDGGILHVPAQDWVESVPLGTTKPPTFRDAAFNGAHELRVAQSGKSATVWAINGSGHVVGQSSELRQRPFEDEIDDLIPTGVAVPLFPTNDAIRHFDAILNPVTKSQQLFALKTGGSVTILNQPGDSKLWTSADMKIPDPEDIKDVNTYTCHVHCINAEGAPLSNSNVEVSTSSEIRGAINGEIVYLSQIYKAAQTDEGGNLTIILPANDLTAPTVSVRGANLAATSFNPAEKAIEKLAASAKNGTMKDACGKDGKALFPNINQEAMQTITKLHDVYKSHQKQSDSGFPLKMSSLHDLHSSDGGSDWSFWHGLVVGIETFLDVAYEAGMVLVRTAKKVWRFIVNTAEQALKAISGVLEWIGAKIEEAVTWLAEQLDWESILDVNLFVKELVYTGLDCAQDLLVMGENKVEEWLTIAENEVVKWHNPPQLPDSIAKAKLQTDKDKDKDKLESMNNPLCKWSESKLQDKQVQRSMDVNEVKEEGTTIADVFKTFFEKVLKPLWETLKDTVGHVWDDLKILFDKNSSVSIMDVFKNIGVDLLLGIIRAMRAGITGIIEVVIEVLKWVRTVLHEKVDIWVISKLYKKMSRGKDLTVLDLATLVFAVPISWLMKNFTGKKPREMPIFANLLTELKSSKSIVTKSSKLAGASSAQSLYTTTFAMMNTNQAQIPVGKSQSPSTGEKEHPADTIKRKIDTNTNFGKLVRLYRGGMMVVALGTAAWTPIDCIYTGICWPKALNPVGLPENYSGALWMRFKPIVSFIAWTLSTLGSMPLAKTNKRRRPDAVVHRWVLWGGISYANFIKLRMPEHMKPPLAGLIGVVDMSVYVFILATEVSGEESDSIIEILQRLVQDGWAIGSCYNCITKAGEPKGLALTGAAGLLLSGGNIVKAIVHYKYWSEHGDDADYQAPTWANSLSGSLF